MAKQPPNRVISPGFSRLTNTQLINTGTGSTSGTNYMYVAASITGDYEILNQVNNPLSGAITNPSPTYTQFVDVNLGTTVDLTVVNIASGAEPSGLTMVWDKTNDGASGGFGLVGGIHTSAQGEQVTPISHTSLVGIYSIDGTGQTIALPQQLTTGMQNYQIMHGQGPHGDGGAAQGDAMNTSATIPAHMAAINSDQAGILQSQASIGQSWSMLFSDTEG